MSREIKFRAWDDKNKKWLHGYKPGGEGCNILGEVILCGGWMSEVKLENLNDVIVEQYTGLKDKNGVDVYENDVIRSWFGMDIKTGEPTNPIYFIVKWDSQFLSWGVYDIKKKTLGSLSRVCADFEVIGNMKIPNYWRGNETRPRKRIDGSF